MANVFAAASTSGCVQVIDPRDPNGKNVIQLSQADINVIDFDYQDENLLYAGDDVGQIFKLDIRNTSQPQ